MKKIKYAIILILTFILLPNLVSAAIQTGSCTYKFIRVVRNYTFGDESLKFEFTYTYDTENDTYTITSSNLTSSEEINYIDDSGIKVNFDYTPIDYKPYMLCPLHVYAQIVVDKDEPFSNTIKLGNTFYIDEQIATKESEELERRRQHDYMLNSLIELGLSKSKYNEKIYLAPKNGNNISNVDFKRDSDGHIKCEYRNITDSSEYGDRTFEFYYNGDEFVLAYQNSLERGIIMPESLASIADKKCPQSFKIYSGSVYEFVFYNDYTGKYALTESQYDVNSPLSSSCIFFKTKDECVTNQSRACVWVEGKDGSPGYCNVDNLQYVKCGNSFDIPMQAPKILSFVINFLKILTPIILILTGIITLVKAVAASKEEEIKKAQSSLIKKIIASAFVFLVVAIVQFVILKVADFSDTDNIIKCMSCFLNGDCDSAYFKFEFNNEDYCYLVKDPSKIISCGNVLDDYPQYNSTTSEEISE